MKNQIFLVISALVLLGVTTWIIINSKKIQQEKQAIWKEIRHEWVAGVSQKEFKAIECNDMIYPRYYYTCVECNEVTVREYGNEIIIQPDKRLIR